MSYTALASNLPIAPMRPLLILEELQHGAALVFVRAPTAVDRAAGRRVAGGDGGDRRARCTKKHEVAGRYFNAGRPRHQQDAVVAVAEARRAAEPADA
jgi:hypothetical protein